MSDEVWVFKEKSLFTQIVYAVCPERSGDRQCDLCKVRGCPHWIGQHNTTCTTCTKVREWRIRNRFANHIKLSLRLPPGFKVLTDDSLNEVWGEIRQNLLKIESHLKERED